jgi:hypothetical protein
MDGEATCSSSDAASTLHLTRQRVDQLYRRGRLKGPSRLPRSPIRLYQWSVAAEASARQTGESRRSSMSTQPDASGDPREVSRQVAALDARLAALEGRLSSTKASNQTLRSANLALNAVFDDLREAIEEDDGAIELLAEALKRSRRATAAVRRAEERRASIIDQFHIPDFPPEP